MPTADNEILHQRSLTKEEITFPKIALTDTGSLELNILAGVWNESAATAHCHEEVQLEKYAHSFLSSPDHVNEFEETWDPAIETDFPNKKQKMNFEQSYELWLKHGYLSSEIGESVEQYETGNRLKAVNAINVSVITVGTDLVFNIDFSKFPQTFLTNPPKLRIYLCKIPTVITETLIV